MSYDGEERDEDWCSNHACYVWQCPEPVVSSPRQTTTDQTAAAPPQSTPTTESEE